MSKKTISNHHSLHRSLCLRYASALPSLQSRFKTVSTPFLRMGEKWDLHGTWREVQKS